MILGLIKNDNKQKEYYLTELAELINRQLDIYQLPKEKEYEMSNVNTPEQLEEANRLTN